MHQEQSTKRFNDCPTNIANMLLVMGCPNSRAGVRIVKKIYNCSKYYTATQILTPSLITSGVLLVVPIFVGWAVQCMHAV